MKGASLSVMVAAAMMMMMVVGQAAGYPSGPPMSACGEMFPVGHHVDAQNSTPPYTLSVSSTTIAAGEQINLTLATKPDQTVYTYFKGMFVQARLATDCNSEPIGTFSIPAGDNFLRLMNCTGKTASAVSNKNAAQQTTKTFTWTAPDTYTDRIFFRATVVKDVATFWTEVFSPFLKYSNDTSADPTEYCKTRESSSVSALAASFFVALVVTSCGLVWNL